MPVSLVLLQDASLPPTAALHADATQEDESEGLDFCGCDALLLSISVQQPSVGLCQSNMLQFNNRIINGIAPIYKALPFQHAHQYST